MIGKEDALKVLEKVVSFAKGFELEASLSVEDLSLTRFYENHIHQNLRRQDHILTVRVVKNRKAGLSQVNLLDDGSLRWAVMSALENADLAGEEIDFTGLPKPSPLEEASSYVPATAGMKPGDRALACGEVISLAKSKGLEAAGSFATGTRETAVASTAGVRAYHGQTEAFFRTIVQSGANTGYGDRLARNVRDIDFEEVAREATDKALLYPDAKDLPPGRYDTIFLEYALADLVRFLGLYSFGAQAKQRGQSFMADKMGQKVMGENITIWDDGLDRRGLDVPFDSEGMPKKRVVLIDKGVASGVVYDTRTAAKDGVQTTGHAGDKMRGHYGPLPGNMLLAEGRESLEEMISSTKKGLLVTRFHYTHCPEPSNVVATGTTRDGTFLIENGHLVARVKNLRFTESMVEAFGRVESISKSTRLTRDWWSTFSSVLPAVKIKDFTFTGATAF